MRSASQLARVAEMTSNGRAGIRSGSAGIIAVNKVEIGSGAARGTSSSSRGTRTLEAERVAKLYFKNSHIAFSVSSGFERNT